MLIFKQTSLILGSLSLILLASSIQVDAQFFTKSSKSIPRMGRRSDSSLATNQQKHKLIDSLLDEYGPQFVAALEGKSIGLDQWAIENQTPSGNGELVLRNDQPFDLTKVQVERLDPTGYELTRSGSRDERSPSGPINIFKDSSLAMRALNLNRLMQHLRSGGQPLTSYDKLFNKVQYRGSGMDQSGFAPYGASQSKSQFDD